MSRARELADLGNANVTPRLDDIGNSEGALSNRNIVTNGSMAVAQRGTSESGVTSSGYYTVDRWKADVGSSGTWTIAQSSTAPDGFANSLKVDCTVTQTDLSGDKYLLIQQKIEGQNLQQLKFGTSNALPITISFYVKSNKTGTYHLNLYNVDNARQNGRTYTIDAADTWEQKTISLDADTAQGFNNDAGASLMLEWWLVAGTDYTSGSVPTAWQAHSNADRAAGLSVNLADSASNEWQITGVQLEVGDTATPFEHRSYGDELAKCQRYFWKQERSSPSDTYVGIGQAISSSTSLVYKQNPVKMRAKPTFSRSGNMTVNNGTARTASTISSDEYGATGGMISANCGSGLSTSQAVRVYFTSDGNYFQFDAEL